MILYTDNQADNAVITSPESSIFNPPSNVKDSRLSRVFKGEEQTSLQIAGSGSLKNISQAYTNLVTDPTDLTTANWSEGNATATDSGETINGYKLWTVTGDSVGTYRAIQNTAFVCTSDVIVFRAIARKGNSDRSLMVLRNNTTAANVAQIAISSFSSKDISAGDGATLLSSLWLDDDTVALVGLANTSSITIGDSLEIRVYSNGSVSDQTNTLWTQPQITQGLETRFPFVNGTHLADVIDETFTMPDRFIVDTTLSSNFQYNATPIHTIFEWTVSADIKARVDYEPISDVFRMVWDDNNFQSMSSQQFDDGTSFTNINQRIRFICSYNTVSGGISDSRFIVIPLDSGSINEDSTWSGTPDVKSSTFPTLSIGNTSGGNQADSEYEYLRVYEGLLVGDVTTSADADALLKDKKILFDQTYQQKITATDLLIANSTINDGDTVLLQGNDVDSWGTGTPLYETVAWSKNITQHNFTKSTYQYYRIFVNSSNVIAIGRVYLGTRLIPPELSPTLIHNRISASLKSRTISGQSNQDSRYFYSTVDVSYPAVTKAQKAVLISMFESVDVGTPFFVEFNETCLDLGTLYATLDQDSLSFDLLGNTDYYSVGLGIIEEV
ncbi:MAG: hypothetical protein GY795_00145 [Desulfobacterales bacterium]|nr:hypothetical protein [Desulfobacterales bacterium]